LRITYINPQYTEITGYSFLKLESFSKEEFSNLYHKDTFDAFLNHIEEIKQAKDEEVFELKFKFKHKTGKYIWCLSRDTVLNRDRKGNVTEIIGSLLDLTNYHDECD
jgi:two-component system CheB/CheR fusion protein